MAELIQKLLESVKFYIVSCLLVSSDCCNSNQNLDQSEEMHNHKHMVSPTYTAGHTNTAPSKQVDMHRHFTVNKLQ